MNLIDTYLRSDNSHLGDQFGLHSFNNGVFASPDGN